MKADQPHNHLGLLSKSAPLHFLKCTVQRWALRSSFIACLDPFQFIKFVYKAGQLRVEDVPHVTSVFFQVPDFQVTGTQHLQSLVMSFLQLLRSHQSVLEETELHKDELTDCKLPIWASFPEA